MVVASAENGAPRPWLAAQRTADRFGRQIHLTQGGCSKHCRECHDGRSTSQGLSIAHGGNYPSADRTKVRLKPDTTYAIRIPVPELPEVEAVRRQLHRVMAGARIEHVETRRAGSPVAIPARFVASLEGQRVRTLRRRAKYLFAELDRATRC